MIYSKNNSNSLKNDVWSVGILLLDMLIDISAFGLKNCSIHPYNWSEEKLKSEGNSIIVDNLKQIYPKSF
jgi:hypothetical protein